MQLLRQLGLSGGGCFLADDEQYSGSRRGERFGHAGSALTSARKSRTWSAWEITLSMAQKPAWLERAYQVGPVAGVGGPLGIEEDHVPGRVR